MQLIYKSTEHNSLTSEDHQCEYEDIKLFNNCIYNENGQEKDNPDLKKYLGIHQTTRYVNSEKIVLLKAHYFIGYRWVGNEKYINVSP